MKKFLTGILFTVLFGTFASIFTWVFFDTTWWVPTESGSVRELMLFMFHLFGLMAPIFLLVGIYNE